MESALNLIQSCGTSIIFHSRLSQGAHDFPVDLQYVYRAWKGCVLLDSVPATALEATVLVCAHLVEKLG